VIGLGAGVVDRLAEMGQKVVGINVATAPVLDSTDADESEERNFRNLRDQSFWRLRTMLAPDCAEGDALCLQEDEGLIEQLCAIRYRINSRGQVEIESKDQLKARGIKSPDRADCLAIAFAPRQESREWCWA
jgi:hypothetical protein